MRKILFFFALLLSAGTLWAASSIVLKSPSGQLKTEMAVEGQRVQLHLFDGNASVVRANTLQFSLEKDIVKGNWQLVGQTSRSVDQSWLQPYGECAMVIDRYEQCELQFRSAVNRKEVGLEVRLYDEGLAFRYHFDPLDFWNCQLTKENTEFLFDKDCRTWVTGSAQGTYVETRLSTMKGSADRPQVVEVGKNCFVAVGEAALVDYGRMYLGRAGKGWGLASNISGKVNLDMARYHTPWRYVMVAPHPGKLVENNYFILNLNEPNRIANTSWIRPGAVIREVTLTTDGARALVDFAAAHHIPYIEFDAGWYGHEYDEKSDATTITVDPKRSKGPLDLHGIISYAKEKGVGVLVYVNMLALKNQLDDILPLYRQWGIKGVKYGFVDVGNQYATAWLHQAIRKAAKYELMLDIHDNYRPTGYSRTYPNLLTQEGIRGDEERPDLQQTLYTFYNRMIAGAGDYTNCFYNERVTEKMGGRAAQLAKRILIYSPFQFIYWYDSPRNASTKQGKDKVSGHIVPDDEVSDFYCSIPTVWDESRFIEGEMGKYAVMARRSGEDWYIAFLNAGDKRIVSFDPSFLSSSKQYAATVFKQPSPKKKADISVHHYSLQPGKITLEADGNSGTVLHLRRVPKGK